MTWFLAIGAVIASGPWQAHRGTSGMAAKGTPGPDHLIAGMIPAARARAPGTHVISSDSGYPHADQRGRG
jgi:hypothetical protein